MKKSLTPEESGLALALYADGKSPAEIVETLRPTPTPRARTRRWILPVCPGCVRRGVKDPAKVRPGEQCSTCADIEEGAY